MRIVRVSGLPDAAVLAQAAQCVAAGGTLIFPTDTVYGIGCAPDDEAAVESIFRAKARPSNKPLAIHLRSSGEATAYAARLSPAALTLMARFWPGPLTLVVQRRPDRGAAAARGGSTIALRCPDAPVCGALLHATGPLAATSANRSGAPAFTGAETDLDALPDATLAIIAGPTKERRESTVLDCSTDIVRILRSGALDVAAIADALAGVAAFERSPR
jgi:L-threonylcarbamoyladenylate synthase